MLAFYGFVVLCSLAGVSADCEKVKTLKIFEKSQFMGTWYETGITNSYVRKQCISYNWFTAPSGKIQFNEYKHELLHNRKGEILSDVRVPDGSKPGQLLITTPKKNEKYTLFILGTDYTSYSVVYKCLAWGSVLAMWTREPHPPHSVVEKALQVMKEHGELAIKNFNKIDRDCWKLGVPSNEKTTTTTTQKTTESPETKEVIAQNEPQKPLALDLAIEISVSKSSVQSKFE